MKQAHNIIAKTALTADLYVSLSAKSDETGKSMSAILRESLVKCLDVKPQRPGSKRPSFGQFQAKFAPSRSPRPHMHVRMNN